MVVPQFVHRRRFLAGATTLVPLVATGGCLAAFEDPALPDGLRVDTHHVVGSHVEDAGIGPSGSRPRSYQTVLADRQTALQRATDDDGVHEFVSGTDFDRSYLLIVVAAAWPSAHSLELESIERVEDGLRVAIRSASPGDAVGDDAAVHSLAIRIEDEQRRAADDRGGVAVPDRVVVAVNGTRTGTVGGNEANSTDP